jgi:Domain of unknown function (DUF1707)
MAGQMPGDPRLRAADTDRERSAELLREHHAVGRLTAEEFHDRLERVFTARTLGDLNELVADLPAIDLYQLPSAGIRPDPRRRFSDPERTSHGPLVLALSTPWIAWAAGSAAAVAAWVAVGAIVGGAAWVPWFLIVIIVWWVANQRRRPPGP